MSVKGIIDKGEIPGSTPFPSIIIPCYFCKEDIELDLKDDPKLEAINCCMYCAIEHTGFDPNKINIIPSEEQKELLKSAGVDISDENIAKIQEKLKIYYNKKL